LNEINTANINIAQKARLFTFSGIMLELSGKREEAIKLWKETRQRFPAEQCNFYGDLCDALAGESTDCIASMPYSAPNRSELFCLAGVLYEKRRNFKRAKELFKMSVKEDPTLRWPAYFAKNMLAKNSRDAL